MSVHTGMSKDQLLAEMIKLHQAKSGGASVATEPGAPPEPEFDTVEMVVPKDGVYKKFSEVFGFLPEGEPLDYPVRVFSPTEWHEDVRAFIPDVDDGFVFPKRETHEFVAGVMAGDVALLHGPKGSGKSTLPAQVCAKMGIPWLRVNCRMDMDSSVIFGEKTVENGTMNYNLGPAAVLGTHGGMLQMDEIASTPPGISLSAQWMMEKNGKIFLADAPWPPEKKLIKPHAWFRVVGTDNTELQGDTRGSYAGTMVQNEAFVDRFATNIKLDYLSEEHEKKLIKSRCPGLRAPAIAKMLRLARLVRTAYQKQEMQFTMSPRALINWGEKMVFWGNEAKALRLAYFNKLTEDDQKLVAELYKKVYNADI